MDSSKKLTESSTVKVLQRKKYGIFSLIQVVFVKFSAASAYIAARYIYFNLRV